MKKPIKERRLDAIYDYRHYSTDSKRSELLDLLLAIASHRVIKEVVEELGIMVNN